MAVIVSMLRGVNVGRHHRIRMDALCALCESLRLREPRTCLQSGNVIFRTEERDLARLARRFEEAFERTFGFRSNVILRTTSEFRELIPNNPARSRPGIDPARLLVLFLAAEPGPEARKTVLGLRSDAEILRLDAREIFVYFPNGTARSKLSPALIEKILQVPGTGRNWNTVTKILDIAEAVEARR